MAYVSFTYIVELDHHRYVEKYIVPEHKVLDDFAEEFMRGDTYIAKYMVEMWKHDESVYNLSTENSVHASGACLMMPPYVFIKRDYICFL